MKERKALIPDVIVPAGGNAPPLITANKLGSEGLVVLHQAQRADLGKKHFFPFTKGNFGEERRGFKEEGIA